MEGLPKAPPRPRKVPEKGGALSAPKTLSAEDAKAFGGLIPVPDEAAASIPSAERSGVVSIGKRKLSAEDAKAFGGLEPVNETDSETTAETIELSPDELKAIEEAEAFGGLEPVTEEGPKISEAEKKRREKVAKTLRWASQADETYLLLLANGLVSQGGEQALRSRERLESIETMSSGREVGRKALGDDEGGSVNVVTKRTYERADGGRTLGYAKSSLGDPTFFLSEKGLMRRARIAKEQSDPEIGEDVYLDVNDKNEAHIVDFYKNKITNFPRLQTEIAAAYGLSPGEVPLNPNDFGPRDGVPVGESAVREWGASRLDGIIGSHVVPAVVLRAETGGADIVSVQEEAKSEHGPLKVMKKSEFDAIVKDGAKHPMARSIMRMAVLDYLIKSADRHPRNILSGVAIDNGLSLGLSKRGPDGKLVPVDPYNSVAMEMAERHRSRAQGAEAWKLDPEMLQSLKGISEEWREARGGGALGSSVKAITQVFRVVYGENAKISSVEFRAFMDRLDEVVKHEGLPPMKIGAGSGELYPISLNEGLFEEE